MDARGIGDTELTEGTRRSTLDELTEWTHWAYRGLALLGHKPAAFGPRCSPRYRPGRARRALGTPSPVRTALAGTPGPSVRALL
jgi:hypothetical protein